LISLIYLKHAIESLLCASPLIKSAVIFGAGRFLNGAIVVPSVLLPSYEIAAIASYLDAIWPHIVEHVNPIIPRHSQLIRPLVLLGSPNKPFVITDKQSINRKLTLKLYVDEVEEAYTRVDEDGYEEVALPEGGLPRDSESITTYVGALVRNVLRGRDVTVDDDLFDLGLDSLLALRIRSSIMAVFKKSGMNISVPQNLVYTLPTKGNLAKYVQDALLSAEASVDKPESDIAKIITDTIEHYSADFPRHQPTMGTPTLDGDVYAVTGSTGSLGSFFLALLLSRPEVRKIYLLNRKTDRESIEQRHQAAFRSRGLEDQLLACAVNAERVVHLEVVLGEKRLGLEHGVYNTVRSDH
jgi:aryl carrier-like protein